MEEAKRAIELLTCSIEEFAASAAIICPYCRQNVEKTYGTPSYDPLTGVPLFILFTCPACFCIFKLIYV